MRIIKSKPKKEKMKKSDDEIMAMAGHPDVVPRVCAQWFLRGWLACEAGEAPKLKTVEVPPEVTQYIEEVYDKVSGGHKVKRIARYGGSIFVVFDDDRTYRVNINKYDSVIKLDEMAKEQQNLLDMAESLEYDHQQSMKHAMLRKADILKSILDEV